MPTKSKHDYNLGSQTDQQQAGAYEPDVQAQIDELYRLIQTHLHDGGGATKVDIGNIDRLFEVVSVVPSGDPKSIYDQVKIYTNGGTYRLYWYDYVAHAWHYATGT